MGEDPGSAESAQPLAHVETPGDAPGIEAPATNGTAPTGAGPSLGVTRILRVIVVAGVPTGVVVVGIGSRLAMFALRLTSPDAVIGVQSDDDFTIGRVTLEGTLTLITLGSVIGLIGAATYLAVRPWLLGPAWFRYLTVALGAGAVGGAILLHSDGIDFVVLEPMWFAIALFVALPFFFGLAIAPAVEWVRGEAPWTVRGWWRVALPVLLLLPFPPAWFSAAFLTVVVGAVVIVGKGLGLDRLRHNPVVGILVRAGFLSIALLGLLALIGDIQSIAEVN